VNLLKDKGGDLCMEPEEVGEIFNEYFASIFTKEKDMADGESGEELTSSGMSTEGEVPEDWRIAHVVSFFKEGNIDKLGNCRPMSLASVVGKLLEKILISPCILSPTDHDQ